MDMDIKILLVADDSNFSEAGEVLKGFSDILSLYGIGFKEAVVMPSAQHESIHKIISYMTGGDSLVLVCGGIGENNCAVPEITASVFKKELSRSKDAADLMALVYDSNKKVPGPAAEKACMFPEKSFIIPNQNSGFSGFYLTEPVFFAAMPLEPKNAVNMFKSHVLGKILGKLGINYFVKTRKYKLFGIKEKEFDNLFEKFKTVAGYNLSREFSYGEFIVSAHVNGISTPKLSENIKSLDEKALVIFKDFLYGYDEDELYGVCSNLLKKNGVKIAVAESLTGGYISARLTDLPGASSYFLYGGVVYSNSAKTDVLGVSRHTVEKEGAVSEKCAMEMAEKAREKTGADIGLAVTGYAGPHDENDSFPEGTVFIALSSDKVKEARKYAFQGSRSDVKSFTVKMALFWIYRLMGGARAASV